jgi:DNA mismatch endonuclease (patch repair protein)
VILVHGCFWHGHDCPMFKRPATRVKFWNTKIAHTKERDRTVIAAVRTAGWRVLVVWECALRGPARRAADDVIGGCLDFLQDRRQEESWISGQWEAARFQTCPPQRSE